MIVSNCPRCAEAFRVPTDELPDDAYAQCPWCRESFPASDLLKALPPVVELLSADGEPIVPVRHQAATIGVVGQAETDTEFRADQPAGPLELIAESIGIENPSDAETVVEDVTADSFDFGEAEPEVEVEDLDSNWVGEQPSLSQGEFAPMNVSRSPAKKRKGGGILTLLGVVLGGVMAVPIAGGLLTLWWGHPPDWGFWPFNGPGETTRTVAAAPPVDLIGGGNARQNPPAGRMLSPDLGNETLSIAPADVAREQIMAEPKVNDVVLDQDADRPVSEPPVVDPPVVDPPVVDVPVADVPIAEVPAAESPMVLPNPSELAVEEPNPIDRASGDDSAVSADLSGSDTSLSMPPVVPDEKPDLQSDESATDTSVAESETDRPVEEIESVPADDSPELIEMADKAGKMVDVLSEYKGDPKDRTRWVGQTYETITDACDLAAGNSKALSTLASKIKNSPLLEELGGAASVWLKYTARKSDGIFLVGQTSTDGEGQTIQLDSGKVVSVVGDVQAQGAGRVLAMGRIIDDDSIELLHAQPLP